MARTVQAVLVCVVVAWGQKPQPIPFSHKVHAKAALQCADCHSIPPPGDFATFPKEDKCMACHVAIKADSPSIRKLAAFQKERKPIPWSRIYQLPDYAVFSHDTHYRKGKVSCETCHGPVAERDALSAEKSISMKTCMDCHDERGASNECNVCHPPF